MCHCFNNVSKTLVFFYKGNQEEENCIEKRGKQIGKSKIGSYTWYISKDCKYKEGTYFFTKNKQRKMICIKLYIINLRNVISFTRVENKPTAIVHKYNLSLIHI